MALDRRGAAIERLAEGKRKAEVQTAAGRELAEAVIGYIDNTNDLTLNDLGILAYKVMGPERGSDAT